jgi:hypothetical protein
LSFPPVGFRMRNNDTVAAAAATPSPPAGLDEAPVRIVCLALLLALGALACRIASIW